MISIVLAEKELAYRIKKLATMNRQEGRDILKETCRLVVKAAIKRTPPVDLKNLGSTVSQQIKMGRATIAKQIGRRAYLDINSLRVRDTAVGIRIHRYVKNGEFKKASDTLKAIGVNQFGEILKTITGNEYKRLRNDRGRIRVPLRLKIATIDSRGITRAVKAAQSKAGMAKAGWLKCAEGLGMKTPKGLSKAKQMIGNSGVYIDRSGQINPSVTIGNDIYYIQDSASRLQVMKHAMDFANANLKKQIGATRIANRRADGFAKIYRKTDDLE